MGGMAMLTPADWVERRSAVRIPVDLDARVFPGALQCRVLDLSDKGARVRFDDPTVHADDLILVLWEDGRAFEAHAVWWRGEEIGVRFIRACTLESPTPTVFAEACRAWM